MNNYWKKVSVHLMLVLMALVFMAGPGFSEDTGAVKILTQSSPDISINAGESARVYGCQGTNRIDIGSGAHVKMLHMQGGNIISIDADSSLFSVSRSGATVSFKGIDGTVLQIPVTETSQKIEFNDISIDLVIENNKVLLGNQEITLTPNSVNATNDNYSTKEIGSEGGTIENNGIKLVVETGSLSVPEVISIKKKSAEEIDNAQLPDDDQILLSAVNFSPDGLAFKSPVTVTFPLDSYVTPGTSLPVFLYDEESGDFIDEGIMGVVNQDGFSCNAKIQHFSSYVVAASLSSPESQVFKFKLYGTDSNDKMFSHVYFDNGKAFLKLVNYMQPNSDTPFLYTIFIRDYNYFGDDSLKIEDVPLVAGEFTTIEFTSLLQGYKDKHIAIAVSAYHNGSYLGQIISFLDWNNDYADATVAKLVLNDTIRGKDTINADNSFANKKYVSKIDFEEIHSLDTTTHRILDVDKIISKKINIKNDFWNESEYALDAWKKSDASDSRTPLLLIHGWQGAIGDTCPSRMLIFEKNEFDYWHNFISYYLATPQLNQAYKLYTYKYPSYKHITFNARMLNKLLVQLKNDNDTVIGKALGTDGNGIVIMGHSMGGLVARSLVEEHKEALGDNAEKLIKLITLDTPHHGSPSALSSYFSTDVADQLVKDLATPGAVDLMWDNYDNKYSLDDVHYKEAVTDINNGDSRYQRLGDKGVFDQAYGFSGMNPWLSALNTNFGENSHIYSDKYIFYVAHSAPNQKEFTHYLNSIRNDWAMYLNTSFINGLGYASGGAEPVCSSILSKSVTKDDVTRFNEYYGYTLIPSAGEPAKFININNTGHENNYYIPYRIFWDYNHERIMNGVYIKKGDWDKYIDEKITLPVKTCDVTSFKNVSRYALDETVSMQYTNAAIEYINEGTNTKLIAEAVEETNAKSYNPLKTEPVFMIMKKDLLDALPSLSPKNITATTGDGNVQLEWDAVDGNYEYTVYYGTGQDIDPNNPDTYIDYLQVTEPSAIIDGLTNGTRYYFGVTARTGAGESALSTVVSAVPRKVTTDGFTNSLGMEFVWIPAGSFMMGSPDGVGFSDERPQHKVTLTKGFWMSKYEVTQGQWKAVMGNNPSYFQGDDAPAGVNTDNLPVEEVSWNDVQEFIKRLNGMTGENYALPSEAQWEYAARGGVANQKYSGSDYPDTVAWYNDNSGNTTHEVGTKASNAWGLHDMSGNVWEWCQDHWHGDYTGAPADGSAWEEADPGRGRVGRGGGWDGFAGYLRSANRYFNSPGCRYDYTGFRLLRQP